MRMQCHSFLAQRAAQYLEKVLITFFLLFILGSPNSINDYFSYLVALLFPLSMCGCVHTCICLHQFMVEIKVIFSNESGQNLQLVKPTQYDSKSHVKSGQHFRFSKIFTHFEYLLFKISLWILVYTYTVQNGHVMTSPANQLAKWSCYAVISQSACK